MSAVYRADINCYVGHWPFRKLRKCTFQDLSEIHKQNGICAGFVSSLNSIFYNDPFEGDEELHESIKGTGYFHILTVNPLLPGYLDDIEKGVRLFRIKGVKIYPGYHGYQLSDPCVEALCGQLKRLQLPLFLVFRMEDERLDYLLPARMPPLGEVSDFIGSHADLKIILLNVRFDELLSLKEPIQNAKNVFFDTSGLKDVMFMVERLTQCFGSQKMLYGSLFPLFCMKSTFLQVGRAEIPEESKNSIFNLNMRPFL